MVRIIFVCLGNICRSPLAEGVFRKLLVVKDLQKHIEVDSAGTGGWHVGQHPDRRMRSTAESHGVSLQGIRARQAEAADLREFDYVFAMDRQNQTDLISLAGRNSTTRIRLFREFDPVKTELDVPDPYYGGSNGFDRVFEIVDRTCRAILDHICDEHNLPCGEAVGDQGKD